MNWFAGFSPVAPVAASIAFVWIIKIELAFNRNCDAFFIIVVVAI